jgi:DNA polymerase III subunit epsilon
MEHNHKKKMKLNLTKPIAFFDIETTGLNVGVDKIMEICILKLDVQNNRSSKSWRINPGIPISAESQRITGITDEMVKDCPDFKTVGPEINLFLENCDLAGYNSNKFDIPVLVEEFLRAGIDFDMKNRRMLDVQNIFHFMEPRTLSAAYRFYCQKELINSHSASADVEATFEVFIAQLDRYKEVEHENEKGEKFFPVCNDIGALCKFTTKTKNVDLAGRVIYNDKGVEVFGFGKYKDKSVKEIFEKDPGYYSWLMQGDFPEYTKKVVTRLRLEMLAGKKK